MYSSWGTQLHSTSYLVRVLSDGNVGAQVTLAPIQCSVMAWAVTCQPSCMVKGLAARCANLSTQVPAPVSVHVVSLTSSKLRPSSQGPCFHSKEQLSAMSSLLLLCSQSCQCVVWAVAEVQLLSLQLRSHVFLDSTRSWGDQAIVASPGTGMGSGRGHCQMLLSLQGLFGHLVMWGCGPQSGGWLHISGCLSCWIWWPLTWQ